MNYIFLTLSPALPIGAAYVAAALRVHGHNVFGHSMAHNSDLKSAILSSNIDVICIGSMLSGEFVAVRRIVQEIKDIGKEINKNLTVVLGGVLISTEPQTVMENTAVDIGVIGQGEQTMCELADALEGGGDLSLVDGLIYKDGSGHITTNRERKAFSDINNLPYPAYDMFEEHLKNGVLCITASRSCPYCCTFCYQPSGIRYIQRSLDSIFKEIEYWLGKYEFSYLFPIDECFAVNEDRVVEFSKRIKQYGLTYGVQMRVDTITPRMVESLKDSGCTGISLGLESADNRILKSMKKNITIEQIEYALELIYNAGIPITANFIFGDIEEDMNSVNTTLNWYKEHLQYPISLTKIFIYPGTALYKHCLETGLIKDKVKQLELMYPYVNVSKLTDEEYAALPSMFYEVYKLRPSKVLEILKPDGAAPPHNIVVECYRCKARMEVYGESLLGCPVCCGLNYVNPLSFFVEDPADLLEERQDSMRKSWDKAAQAKENVIFYGASQKLAILLMNLNDFQIPFDFTIWDLNADNIEEGTYGHPISKPDFEYKVTGEKYMVITMVDTIVASKVKTQFEGLGYTVFCSVNDFLRSVGKHDAKVSHLS